MEATVLDDRSAHRSPRTAINEASGRRGSRYRRLSPPSVAAGRRLSLRVQPTIPHLTRSSLHRCFQRHGISRLPDAEGDRPQRSRFKRYPIGFFHIDIAEVRTEQGKLYLLVAIDRTSKFAFVQRHEKATRRIAGAFLRALAEAVPYKIRIVLTDNGTHFTEPNGDGW